ncbi:MAG TPA: acetate--CoA ligase family protein [Candidatus Limnocylindrales bacterium]|jgi:acyl-CoA synthetase (NDP forming)
MPGSELVPRIDLRPLFAPRSIAVVGASPRSALALTVRDNLRRMGSETRCWFVNPRYEEIHGEPAYPTLGDLPERPDTVILAVNPLRATRFALEAAEAGVPSLVIPGGGVVEGGEAAATMQREVRDIAIRHGIALLGPNCMGMVDWTTNATNYIGDVNPWLRRGHIAGIAQSGSVTDAFIHAPGTRIGYSRIVSVGAEVVLDLCDYLAYCLDDPETHAVMLFVEGFKRPERFLALADHALELGKPILAVKVGRSHQARAAAIAHSGSLAGEDRVTDAALDAVGVIRCDDLDELLEAAELVAGMGRLGRGIGRGRTGVVTVSTGEASLVADLAARTGLDLPPVPDAARDAILRDLPTMGYVANPLDPWGADEAPAAYAAAFEALAASAAYDVLAIVHDSPFRDLPSEVDVARDVSQALIDATAGRPGILPVYVSLTSGDMSGETKATLDAAGGMPMLRGALEAFGAIGRLAWWERRRGARAGDLPRRPGWAALAASRLPWGMDDTLDPLSRAAAAPTSVALPERESLARLAAAGVPVTPVRAVPGDDGGDGAVAAWRELRAQGVVLKLDAVGLAHKTEAGGVRLGLSDEAAIRAAASELRDVAAAAGIEMRGLLVEPMAAPGVELIVGGRRDAVFGPAVLVGLGGILAEVLDDVAVLLAPVSAAEVRERLGTLRAAPILHGVRAQPGVDLDALAAFVVAIGDLLVADPSVVEIDCNPVIAGPRGAVAVDALVVEDVDGSSPTA